MRRPIVLLLFAGLFVSELGWSGVAPLLPSYAEVYGLSDVATGLILTIASVGILVMSLPAGALSRRFAARTLTLWAMAAMTIGNLVVGLSRSYGALLGGRALAGMGLGLMWVAATAWLHDAAGSSGSRALAMTTAVVGAGSLIGPAITGVLAERVSLGFPFVVLGTMTAVAGLSLGFAPSSEGRVAEPAPPLREMLRAARADHLMLTSLALALCVSLMWLTTELLIPLRLDDAGFSPADIGLAFSASSLVFIASSAVAARRADRYATVRVAATWTGLFVLGLLIAAAGTSVAASVAFLLAGGVTSGVMIALTYPLGVIGARQGGFSIAVVGALLNVMWASAGLLGPTLGGAIAGSSSDRLAFAALALLGAGAATWMWVRRDRTPSLDRPGPSSSGRGEAAPVDHR